MNLTADLRAGLKSRVPECARLRAQPGEPFQRARKNHARRTCNIAAPEDGRTPAGTLARLGGLGWLCLLCAVGPQKLFSAPAPATHRPPNRWLLIVETSRAMQPRAEAVAQIAGNLALSGMNGQVRPGDTLGLWTFNAGLHRGEFPLQTWTADNTKAVAESVALFLARQKFEGRPSRSQVFPAMNGVISNSEFITVILISSGGETFSGTPFDKAINEIHQQWQSQQEKAHQPFLTMLRAQGGRITDFEVGRPPGPLEFPPLPPELQVADPVTETPPVPKPAATLPTPIVPNLIVHGKKPEPVAEIISNPPPVIVLATNVPASVEVKTNPPASVISKATNAVPAATNPAAVALPSGPSTNLAVTAATESSVNEKTLWVAGVVAAGAAVGLVWVLARRSRSQTRVSLITRSLDRDKK